MESKELLDKIQQVIARACNRYTDNPIGKERFVGDALQILSLLEQK